MKTYLKIPSNIFNSQFDNSEQSKTEGQFLRDSLAKKQLFMKILFYLIECLTTMTIN